MKFRKDGFCLDFMVCSQPAERNRKLEENVRKNKRNDIPQRSNYSRCHINSIHFPSDLTKLHYSDHHYKIRAWGGHKNELLNDQQ